MSSGYGFYPINFVLLWVVLGYSLILCPLIHITTQKCRSNPQPSHVNPNPTALNIDVKIWRVVSHWRLHNTWRHCFIVSHLFYTEHIITPILLSLTATLWCCYFFPTHYASTPMFGQEHVLILSTYSYHYPMVVALHYAFKYCQWQYFPWLVDLSGLSASRPLPMHRPNGIILGIANSRHQVVQTARIVHGRISRIYDHLRQTPSCQSLTLLGLWLGLWA